MRRPLVCLALALCAAALSACGGGGGGTSSTSAHPSAAPPAETGAAAQAPASTSGTTSDPKQLARERRRAGRAAAFVHAGADNSVPTFGRESSAAQRRAAEAVVRAFLSARAAGEWGRACAQLAAANAEGLAKLAKPGKETCPQVLRALTSSTANPLRGPLSALRVKGQNAFALFVGAGGQQYIVPMQREGGSWRWTQSTPIPYPPEAGAP